MVDIESAVSGADFKRAKAEMEVIERELQKHRGKGFNNKQSLMNFVSEYNLGNVVYNRASQSYSYVRHDGLALKPSHWRRTYSDTLFYYSESDGEDRPKRILWEPDGYEFFSKPKWVGEDTEGGLPPMYHRDYFTPTGYFDKVRGTFNIAQPSEDFAIETGRDTKHIYALLNALCNYNRECYLSLLAWLREKIIHPTEKIGVVPIFHTYAGGTGKSAFGDVICRGLFGSKNILVTYQFDVDSRFNADQVDKLVVCIEEHSYESKRNNTESLKSSVTATTVRKENKGVDPVYQRSYTDFCMSTNKDVAVRLDDLTAASNRRFFMMDGDEEFRRDVNPLADEIFTMLYGADDDRNRRGRGFAEDPELISQFKYELVNNKDLEGRSPRHFPRDTDATKRAYYVPRKADSVEIESIVRSIIPFAKASLLRGMEVGYIDTVDENGNAIVLQLDDIIVPGTICYSRANKGCPVDRIGFARCALFKDDRGNPLSPSVVSRVLSSMRNELAEEWLEVLPGCNPPTIGFVGLPPKLRKSDTLWFILKPKKVVSDPEQPAPEPPEPEPAPLPPTPPEADRIGKRVRYSDDRTRADPEGRFETVNELLPGKEKERCSANCAHLDTFLLETDITTDINYKIEDMRLEAVKEGDTIQASYLFENRISSQRKVAQMLYQEGVAARAVYSGCKSIHILVRVSPAPNNLEERKWLDGYLRATLGRGQTVFDPQVGDPARLTRAPVVRASRTMYKGRVVLGTQKLLYENWNNVYKLDWQGLYAAWVNRPYEPAEMRGCKMVPTAQKYVDACYAILKGKFFSSHDYDGSRNELFFPAYRLCRSLGFGIEELWECIEEDLKTMIKPQEYNYWSTRKDSDIIRSIDNDYG